LFKGRHFTGPADHQTARNRGNILVPKLLVLLLILLTAGYAIAGGPGRKPAVVNRRPEVSSTDRPLRLFAALAARVGTGGAVALTMVVGVLLVVGMGSVLGLLIIGPWGAGVDALNSAAQRVAVTDRKAWLTAVMRMVTFGGDSTVVMCVALVVGLALWWWSRDPRPLGLLTASYVGARVIETTVKALTQRPRPPDSEAMGDFTGFAFPSGHATYAMAVYGMVAVLGLILVNRRRGFARVGATALLLLIVLIGLSRVYLGAHWLSDVLGGFLVSGVWLAFLLGLGLLVAGRIVPRTPLLHWSEGMSRGRRTSLDRVD
jgi:membrane-associated phospholipid phosphatase